MKPTRWARFAIVALISAASVLPVTAEVSVDIHGPNNVQIIILGITEGPDPFGMWEQFRDIEADRILNAEGAIRGDGPPDTAVPSSGLNLVTWAYQTGTDFDIAVAEWTGLGWGDPVFLTSTTTDDIDPRVHVEDDAAILEALVEDELPNSEARPIGHGTSSGSSF